MSDLILTIRATFEQGAHLRQIQHQCNANELDNTLILASEDGPVPAAPDNIDYDKVAEIIGGIMKTQSGAILAKLADTTAGVEMIAETVASLLQPNPKPEMPNTSKPAEAVAIPPKKSGRKMSELPHEGDARILRVDPVSGIPTVVTRNSVVHFSPLALAELLQADTSTIRGWLRESKMGVKLRPEGRRSTTFVAPHGLLRWAASRKQIHGLQSIMKGSELNEAIKTYITTGKPYIAPPPADDRIADKPQVLTANSSSKDVEEFCHTLGLKVEKSRNNIRISHPTLLANPLNIRKDARECRPNIFNKLNALLR